MFNGVGVVLWKEGSLWLPMIVGIVLDIPLTLVRNVGFLDFVVIVVGGVFVL